LSDALGRYAPRRVTVPPGPAPVVLLREVFRLASLPRSTVAILQTVVFRDVVAVLLASLFRWDLHFVLVLRREPERFASTRLRATILRRGIAWLARLGRVTPASDSAALFESWGLGPHWPVFPVPTTPRIEPVSRERAIGLAGSMR